MYERPLVLTNKSWKNCIPKTNTYFQVAQFRHVPFGQQRVPVDISIARGHRVRRAPLPHVLLRAGGVDHRRHGVPPPHHILQDA